MQIANTLVKANINVFVILVTMEMKSCVCRSTLAAPIMVAVLNVPPLASMRGQDSRLASAKMDSSAMFLLKAAP